MRRCCRAGPGCARRRPLCREQIRQHTDNGQHVAWRLHQGNSADAVSARRAPASQLAYDGDTEIPSSGQVCIPSGSCWSECRKQSKRKRRKAAHDAGGFSKLRLIYDKWKQLGGLQSSDKIPNGNVSCFAVWRWRREDHASAGSQACKLTMQVSKLLLQRHILAALHLAATIAATCAFATFVFSLIRKKGITPRLGKAGPLQAHGAPLQKLPESAQVSRSHC